MDKDIGPIIEGWDYRPTEVSVRRVRGLDGKEKVQIRVDLGVLQIEVEGRPDGKRPFGRKSLLEYYESLVEAHRRRYGSDDGFTLTPNECAELEAEAMQYYHRRLAFFELHEYERAQQDAEHNLQLFELVKRYAEDEEDQVVLDQYRGFVLAHWTRAGALASLQRKRYDEAIQRIEAGIRKIEEFLQEYEDEDFIEEAEELDYFREWLEEVRSEKPLTAREHLERELEEAIGREEFERAAQLRDRIQNMGLEGR